MEYEAEVEGIGVGVDGDGGSVPAVILAARGEYLPIFVTSDQAQSVELALKGEPFERPLTHDLMLDFVTELGCAIDRIRIDDLSEGTFYAKIDIERYGDGDREKFVFDARPSDGVALAVRAEAPIVVAGEILDEAGRDPEELEASDPGDLDDVDPAGGSPFGIDEGTDPDEEP